MPTEEIGFEGSIVVVDSEVGIHPGDLYMAKRNTGWKLLTCKKVDTIYGWIEAVEPAYAFDIHECKKVLEIK